MSKKKTIKLTKNVPVVKRIHVIRDPELLKAEAGMSWYYGSTIDTVADPTIIEDDEFTLSVYSLDKQKFADFIDKHGSVVDNAVWIQNKVFRSVGELNILRISLELSKHRTLGAIVFKNCVFMDEFDGCDLNIFIPVAHTVEFRFCTFKNHPIVHIGDHSFVTFSYPECDKCVKVVGDPSSAESSSNAFFDHADGIKGLFAESLYQVSLHDGKMPNHVFIDHCYRVNLDDLLDSSEPSPVLQVSYSTGQMPSIFLNNCRLGKDFYVSVRRSVVSLTIQHSSIRRLDITDCTIDHLRIFDSYIKYLNPLNTVCKDYGNQFCDTKIELLAPTSSQGFPQYPAKMYKKVHVVNRNPFSRRGYDEVIGDVILKLDVPSSAKKHVETGTFPKVRVEAARVEAVLDLKGNEIEKLPWLSKLVSGYDETFFYRLGKIATPKSSFDESNKDCGSGIHGFLDLKTAVDYHL